MPQHSLEERVARLEEQMGKLLRYAEWSDKGDGPDKGKIAAVVSEEPGPDDWKSTVGMFRGDAVFKEMIDEAAARREEERLRAREEPERESA